MKHWLSGKTRKGILVFLALVLCSTIVFAGCTPSGGQDGDATGITLNAESIQLDIYDTYKLVATVEGSDAKPEWASLDESVATVNDGVVTAVKAGTTAITATVGDVSATCFVTVVNSYVAPVIIMNTSDISLGLEQTYNMDVRVMYKGEVVTEPLEYTWTLADGAEDGLVTVTTTEYGAEIKALAYGKTCYTVSTTYRGQVLAQNVNIKVTNLDVTFEISNLRKYVGAYKASLGLFATADDVTNVTPKVAVYYKGEPVKTAKITWTSEDPAIATVDANGKITAVSAGTVYVIGTYDNAEIPILVEVYRTEVKKEMDLELVKEYQMSLNDFKGAGEVIDVLLNGETVLKKIDENSGILKLDEKLLPEVGKPVSLTVVAEKAQFVTEGLVVTMTIDNEKELNQFPAYATKYPAGYFVIGQDITCTGTYSSNATVAFTGTFDGRGHAIYNFTLEDVGRYGRGLFGMGFGGPGASTTVMKDISFVNAKHSKDGTFLAQQGGGRLENVYINITMTDLVTEGGHNKTSALFAYHFNSLAFDKVIVEHNNLLVDVGTTGYAITNMGLYGKFQGLYIIGADKVYDKIVDNKSDGDVYAAFANYKAFQNAGINLEAWENDFWTVSNKIPYPKSLASRSGYTPSATAPAEANSGSEVVIEGVGALDEVVLSAEAKKAGVTLTGNKLTIPEGVKDGTVVAVTVRSVVNTKKAVTLEIKVNSVENLTLEQKTFVDLSAGNTFTVDLSAYQDKLAGATIMDATVGTASFTTKSIAGNVVTLDTATLSSITGETTLVVTLEGEAGKVAFTVPAVVCTKVIRTAQDLKNFPAATVQNPNGYYALANNIDMAGITYSNANGDAVHFTGTFDGQGYVISNFCPKSGTADWAGGLFGKHFNGTLKNVSFYNAIVNGQGSFLACKGNGGTMENLYFLVKVENLVSSYTTNGWINNTSIFFNTTPASTIKMTNVVLEYAEPLTNNNGWGYAVGECGGGTITDSGFYIVGADKTAANSGDNATDCYADRDAFDADVSSWDGNGFWTVVDGYPVPNEVLNMPAVPDDVTADLSGITNVETSAAGTTFTVNFGDNKTAVEGATLTSVTVDGTAFTTKSYTDGILTLDLATVKSMTGEKTVIATFTKGEQTIIVNAKVLLCTAVIDSASELAALPGVMKTNPAGYFVLAKDIDMAGVAYENTNTDAFTGTFDGQGYTIYNMTAKKTADDWDGGFFGKLFKGTLKNISFANATVKGQGAFLAFRGVTAKLENVYMYVRFADRVAGLGWINDSSVLFNDGENNYIYATNVVIEYAEALPANSGSGYPVYGNFNMSQINGLYVVGADNISVNTLSGSSTKYACYADRGEFNADVSSWNGNGFWTVVDGFPIPNRLVGVDLSGPVESSLDIAGVHTVGLKNTGTTFTVNFGAQADALAGTTLSSAKVGDTPFTTKSYADGVLTLDKAALGTELGEKAITLVFESAEKRITVNVTAKTYTMTIGSASDLQAFPGVAATVKDGYYVLTADIDMEGKTFANTNGGGGDSDAFTGTFDGQGYTVSNFCPKSSASDWAGGLFGKNFKGTLKNVSFVDAIVNGQGSFLACKGHGGTLENVYFRVKVQNLVSNINWVNNTSILFNTTPSSTIQVKNVILEYAAPLTGNNGWGYAVGECGGGTITDNGFYILGADKTAANNGDNATACYTDRTAFKAAAQDLTAWDGNGFWTVKDGFPIPNRLIGTKWEAEPKQDVTIDLSGTQYVQTGISGSNFTVDLSTYADTLAGTTLTSATVEGTPFATKSYADGVLTLDKASAGTAVGAKQAVVIFESGSKRVTVNMDLYVCTMAISTTADMQNFPTVLATNLAGHFVVANDIDMNGVAFVNNIADTVTATFDGQGHIISNFATKTATNDWDGGLFGKMFQGKLTNIVFDNAIVKGQGAFLAFRGNNSTLENVYFKVAFDNMDDTNGFTAASSVLYNDCQGSYVYINNVIIEYAAPLTATYGGYAIFQSASVSKFNGFYIIGAQKVSPSTLPGSSTAYGCYADRAALKAAGIDFSSWYAGGFWAEHATDLIPVPTATVN